MIGITNRIEAIVVEPYTTPTCISNVLVGGSKWQNPANRFDVNGDGVVDQNDYTRLSDFADQYGYGVLSKGRGQTQPYVDVDGDGQLTERDLAQLAAYLSSGKVIDTSARSCHAVNTFTMNRDLVEPGTATTVRHLGALKNAAPTSNYYTYLYFDEELTPVDVSAALHNRDVVVFVNKSLFTTPTPYTANCDAEPCILRLIKQKLRIAPPAAADEGLPEVVEEVEEVVDTLLSQAVVIAIYDEADEYYVGDYARLTGKYEFPGTPESRYAADKAVWDSMIERALAVGNVSIRFALIQPTLYKVDGTIWQVKCDSCPWPGDTDRPTIDHVLLPGPSDVADRKRTPRVTSQEIIDVVNTVTNNGVYVPTSIIFIIDSSGSSKLSEYEDQLNIAKSLLSAQYSDMKILVDRVTFKPERWLTAAAGTITAIAQAEGISL